jgi:hypothetical protein
VYVPEEHDASRRQLLASGIRRSVVAWNLSLVERFMQRHHVVLSACVLISAMPVAWAAGGGPMQMPQGAPRMQTSADQAKSAYNDGIRDVHKADK